MLSSVALFIMILVNRMLKKREIASDMESTCNIDAEKKEKDTNTSASIIEEKNGIKRYSDTTDSNKYGLVRDSILFLIPNKGGYIELTDNRDILRQKENTISVL